MSKEENSIPILFDKEPIGKITRRPTEENPSRFSMAINAKDYAFILNAISRCLREHGYKIVRLELKAKDPDNIRKCKGEIHQACLYWYFDWGKHQILINEPYANVEILRAWSSGGFTQDPPIGGHPKPTFHDCLCKILNQYNVELRSLWAREAGHYDNSVWWTFNFYDVPGSVQKSYTYEIDVEKADGTDCYWVTTPGNGTIKVCD